MVLANRMISIKRAVWPSIARDAWSREHLLLTMRLMDRPPSHRSGEAYGSELRLEHLTPACTTPRHIGSHRKTSSSQEILGGLDADCRKDFPSSKACQRLNLVSQIAQGAPLAKLCTSCK